MPEAVSERTVRALDRQLRVMARRLAKGIQTLRHLTLKALDERLAHHDWVTSCSPPLPDCRVEHLFIEQAMRSPKSTALCSEGVFYSYRDVLRAARQVAGHICSSEPFVAAVLADRSHEMPVALLGVLMAGGAFLPLAPELPQEKLSFMTQEGRAEMILATTALEDLALSMARDLQLPLHVVSKCGSFGSAVRQGSCWEAAYILFTSGSTGRPKGVTVGHRGLLSHLMAYIGLFLSTSDRVLLTCSITFDMAYSQIFGALLSGAQLFLTRANPMVDPPELLRVLGQDITFTTLVPSVLSSLLHLNAAITLPALRHLGCGGEALGSVAQEFFQKSSSPARLHNRYGPTECSINALLFGPFRRAEAAVPVGYPSRHRHAHVRQGELVLGGPGVASYVSADGAAFRQSPHGAGLEYRSGDLVRRSFRGCLDFRGRVDAQVKVRGQRVDLSDLEAQLQGVVLQVQGRLVAFVSDAAAARRRLGALRPELREVTAWPRTASGKVDRKALAALALAELDLKAEGPEQLLSQALQQVLGVAVSTSLAALGLSSLQALRVRDLCAKQGLRISIRALLAPDATVHSALAAGEGEELAEALEVLVGRRYLVLRDMGGSKSSWEVLLCPGDGGAGVEGYRPLAKALTEVCHVLLVDGLLSTSSESLASLSHEILELWPCSGRLLGREMKRHLGRYGAGAACFWATPGAQPCQSNWRKSWMSRPCGCWTLRSSTSPTCGRL